MTEITDITNLIENRNVYTFPRISDLLGNEETKTAVLSKVEIIESELCGESVVLTLDEQEYLTGSKQILNQVKQLIEAAAVFPIKVHVTRRISKNNREYYTLLG